MEYYNMDENPGRFAKLNKEGGEGIFFGVFKWTDSDDLYKYECVGVFDTYQEAEDYIRYDIRAIFDDDGSGWGHTADWNINYRAERVILKGDLAEQLYVMLTNEADGRSPQLTHVSSSIEELKKLVNVDGEFHTWMVDKDDGHDFVHEDGGFVAGEILPCRYMGKLLQNTT